MNHPATTHQTGRREFCRHIAYGLIASVAGGVPCVDWLVAEVHADSLAPGQFLLNLAGIPALANVNGSAVLSLPGAPAGLANIVVTHVSSNQFCAVDSTCTHSQCEVQPCAYNPSTAQNEILCSCHGSRFKATGELLVGPAERNLRAYGATLISPTQLRIDIPEIRFSLGAVKSQPVSGINRLKLTFPALAFLTYNVRFRARLKDPWVTVNFSRFPGGQLIQADYPGIGADAEVYVAAPQPAGFFSVLSI